MSEQPEELDFEERRKRLEQLFAADPHLSPTMRARQLLGETPESSNGHQSVPDVAASLIRTDTEFADSVAPSELSTASIPLDTNDPVALEPRRMSSIADARMELRARSNNPGDRPADSLDELRERVLSIWKRDIYTDR